MPTTPSLTAAKSKIEQFVAHCGPDDPDAKADVAQQSLIKVWRHGHKFRGDAAFDSWLYRVVRNESISWIRRESRRSRLTSLGLGIPEPQPDIADQTAHSDLVERLLSGLGYIDRTILDLTYRYEMTSVEVADIVGMADSSVRCRLMRLRRNPPALFSQLAG